MRKPGLNTEPSPRPSKSWLTGLCIGMLCASTLTGCASSPIISTKPTVPASLTTECPPLSKPENGTGAALLPWAVETVELYRECAAGKKALIEAVK